MRANGVTKFEEPVSSDDLDGLREVREQRNELVKQGAVGAYRVLRDAVELAVTRINGVHAEVGSAPVLTHGCQLRLAATVC
jgi:L-alanine-DL-glutamate epimerase-like enolase superfamily enzyme